MTIGTVKWFNSAKGFGFIEPEDGSKDAFVHISAVERAGIHSLNEGQKVEYELQPGRLMLIPLRGRAIVSYQHKKSRRIRFVTSTKLPYPWNLMS